MDTKKERYFCIFGGGAIRGLTYVGAVKALREKGIELTGYAGSSAGSIAAVMAALEYTQDEMTDIFMQFDYTLFRDINFSFKFELAISKGEVFTDKIRELISKKINTDKPVLFKDFPKDLYIIASNLTSGKSIIFSKETTPDFEVAQAVRISSGFPGLMNPYELDGEYYVDGDLGKAYALSQISPLLNPPDVKILEFRLEGAKQQQPSKNPLVYLNNALDFLCNAATENVLNLYGKKDKYDFIVLETKDTLLFDLNISKEQREYLIKLGYDTTKSYFENQLPEKRKILNFEYKILSTVLEKVNKLILKKDYAVAKEVLTEYFCEKYNEFGNLDENIIKKLMTFTKMMLTHKTKKIFFISFSDNYKELKDLALELISIVKEKI